MFDKNYTLLDQGFKRVSTVAKEDGTGMMHEELSYNGVHAIPINEPGYVYIWLSNEETTPVEVYFDDFKVTQIKSPVIQTDSYYPFGADSKVTAEKTQYSIDGFTILDQNCRRIWR